MPFSLTLQSLSQPATSSVIKRASVASDGTQANGSSEKASLNHDGRYLVFQSSGSNFIAGDNATTSDIFRKDVATGALVAASLNADGVRGDYYSFDPHISSDGQFVSFHSPASNFASPDIYGVHDAYRKNVATGEIIRVSQSADGVEANDYSAFATMSADGRFVAFMTYSTNISPGDTSSTSDIYLKDCTTGSLIRVSVTAAGIPGNGAHANPVISADGRYVVFESLSTNFVAGDTNAKRDLFRKDLVTGALVRVSTKADGQEANGDCYDASLSADGRYLLFTSKADNLVPNDLNGSEDIFRKDLETGEIMRVSTSASGFQGNNNSTEASISADGRYALFNSLASNLVPNDTNGSSDVFRKDLMTGEILRVSLNQIGTEIAGASTQGVLSADGLRAAFTTTASTVVTGDTNGVADIFWVDIARLPDLPALAAGRMVDVRFDVGNAASAHVAWGDGDVSTMTPANGSASFTHTYAAGGVKAAVATVTEGAQSWSVAYKIDLAAGTMVRDTTLADTLAGGAGNDTLVGDGGVNAFNGKGGNDVIDGNGGDLDTAAYSGAMADYTITRLSAETVTIVDKQAGRDGSDQLKNVRYAEFGDTVLDLRSVVVQPPPSDPLPPATPSVVHQILRGTSARDALKGGLGDDKLYGRSGNDVLTGNGGRDIFVFNTKPGKTNLDKIVDFNVRDDSVWLDNAVFAKIGSGTESAPGRLNKAFLTVGPKAKDKNDFIIYNNKTGVLSYDADGSGAKAAVAFATLKSGLKLTYADFFGI